MGYYEQALVIVRDVGDPAGEAVTRHDIAIVHRGAGRLEEAVAELELVVALAAAVEHPDLEADTRCWSRSALNWPHSDRSAVRMPRRAGRALREAAQRPAD